MSIRRLLVAILLILSPTFAHAYVTDISLEDLVKKSNTIVIATVDEIYTDSGTKIAHVEVEQTLKGSGNVATAFVLASKQWMCDVADAEKGERAVFFLNPIKDRAATELRAQREGFDISLPPTYDPLFEIAYNGRGRMPIVITNDRSLTIVYDYYVSLPRTMRPVTRDKSVTKDQFGFHAGFDLSPFLDEIKKNVTKVSGNDLHDRVGQVVDVNGKFSLRGMTGPFVVFHGEPIYLEAKTNFTWGKPYSDMEGKKVSVTGVLHYLDTTADPPTDKQHPPDHFWIEAETAKVVLLKKKHR